MTQTKNEPIAESQENVAPPKEQEIRSERKKKLIIILCLVLVALAGGIYWFLHRGEIDTDDAYTHGRIVAIAPHVDGFVQTMNIDDNQFVHKGDLLVQLDGRDYQADLDRAQASLEQAIADLQAYKMVALVASKDYPGALISAKGSLKVAQARLLQAQRDYQRQISVKRAATSQHDIDAAKATLDSAEGQMMQAEGNLMRAMPVQAQIDQSDAHVSQAQAGIAQARANLEKARLDFGWTQVRAPQDGWISQRNIERGTFVSAGQNMFSIVPKDVWIVANFKETQLNKMRRGQPVTITVDAYPDLRLAGHVDSFQMGTGESFSVFPPENATGNFVKTVQRVPVKIVIDRGLDESRPLALGLSVEPVVHTLDFPVDSKQS